MAILEGGSVAGPDPEPIPVEDLLSGGESSQTPPDPSAQSAFLLTGDITFGPFYSPKRISVSKERELNRQETFCGGEDVTDLGSKNREIHIAGRLLESELEAFEGLLDNNEPLDMTTPGWTGEIMVKSGEYEGPVGRDSRTREYFFQYSLDVVSTGRDESGNVDYGIVRKKDGLELSDEEIDDIENGEMLRR